MIDFENAKYIKLHKNDGAFDKELEKILTEGEEIISSYQAIRDGVVFSNKRIFVVNIQGLTGKKKDITSLPYSKIQAFSIESAGVFDLDSELELWFSGLGKIKLEFTGSTNISEICKTISTFTL